jgi:hypothetical protein
MSLGHTRSYTATKETYPMSVFVNADGKVLGVVDYLENKDVYAAGEEVPVIIAGITKLKAVTYAYDSSSSSWVKTPAKPGDRLYYDTSTGQVRIYGGSTINWNTYIGKVDKVIIAQTDSEPGIYEIVVGGL